MRHIASLACQHEQDVVTARQRAAHISQLLGFDAAEQTRVGTAVSEIVRNAVRYGRGGRVEFSLDEHARPQRLIVRVEDSGPGIARLADVLSGVYRSPTGLGIGISGARRLMDRFAIESDRAGTRVVLEKLLTPRQEAVTEAGAREIAEVVARKESGTLLEEMQRQNQALLQTLDELQRKQEELAHLNHELEDTNRGVLALYAELDEKADHLRRADELKSRFLSNMTHEFRTPVNSIIGLADLMISDRRKDGRPLEPEVVYIRQAASQLSDLVNDLLDLAKVEAGKTVVRAAEFKVADLFGALRGMLRPLFLNESVALIFEEADALPPVYTDEAKLSQILRNLISNALKFTERGEIRVAARLADGLLSFSVADTGIGIAPADQARIFEEFAQVEHRIQRNLKGTGLGLPLSRRLAQLLGGGLSVQSEPGVGSIFTVTVPSRYQAVTESVPAFEWVPEPGRLPLLVVESAPDAQFFYEKVLRTSAYQLYPARTLGEAEIALTRTTPAAIVLDAWLDGQETWEWLVRLRRSEKTASIPVVSVSASDDRRKALALGADAYLSKPVDRSTLVDTLHGLQFRAARPLRVLVVDDEEIARYLIAQSLQAPGFAVHAAASGEAALEHARRERPDVILLDLVMPDMDGPAVLAALRSDPALRDTPVVLVTSQVLDAERDAALLREAEGVFSKSELALGTLGEFVRAAATRARS
jgi:signal transduction histidine kinase/CheY-like chemotaxis protein